MRVHPQQPSKQKTSNAAPRSIRLGKLLFLLKGILGGLFIIICVILTWDVLTYNSQAWLDDYVHLKRELAQNYANLDWAVQHRKMDLKQLDEETQQSLSNSYSRIQATLTLRRFVRAFRDPHLRLVIGNRSSDTENHNTRSSSAPASSPRLTAIHELGYEIGERSFRFPFESLPQWRQLDNQYFPIGISRQLGVLRIASFGEDQYLDACRTVFQPGVPKDQLKLAVRDVLQAKLKDSLSKLQQAGAKQLLVDITGNGGGTEWIMEIIPLFTNKELYRRSTRYAAPAADRSAIWQGMEVVPVLSPEGEPQRLIGQGIWNGPLFVLIDQGTGSASEDFTAWLKENKAAVILGERTAGAGGGYVNGGGRIRLKAGYFDVMAPNCARFLAEGTNEIEGITPDIPIQMKSNQKDKLAQELLQAIQ